MARAKLAILTGAGMSAESGLQTFRGADGLWEGHDIQEVASPEGWARNPELVLDFYNQRRKQLISVLPNSAHLALVRLEEVYDVHIITQNVDDLHERAGSANILHLHGELRKVRSTQNPSLVYAWDRDLNLGDTCKQGSQLRPHIVWFGESVPMIEPAIRIIAEAEVVLIIGTSMQVYPAASLVAYAKASSTIYYIDPNPHINYELSWLSELKVVAKSATAGVPEVIEQLMFE